MADYHGFDPILAAELSDAVARSDHPDADRSKARLSRKSKPPEQIFTKEQQRRQSEATQSAFILLGRERAIAFLNGHDDSLGGRPLDLATESADGLARVKSHLAKAKTGG